jgi:hypothetical protein
MKHTDETYGEKIPLLSEVLDNPGLKNFSFTALLQQTD